MLVRDPTFLAGRTSWTAPSGVIRSGSMTGPGKADPVVVFCAYAFHVGCKTAITLREAGFDAKYMKSGHSAWKAIGGRLKLYT
jgi:rhodanese-related sulfurtransferase